MAKDGKEVSFDLSVKFQIIDPVASVTKVKNIYNDSKNVTEKLLRDFIERYFSQDIPFRKREIGMLFKEVLERAVKDWGVKIISVELK